MTLFGFLAVWHVEILVWLEVGQLHLGGHTTVLLRLVLGVVEFFEVSLDHTIDVYSRGSPFQVVVVLLCNRSAGSNTSLDL